MEKLLVVAGIWTMCALCAALFIRGATCAATRPVAQRLRVARGAQAGKVQANDV
jgi:hypothetical protein